MLDEHLPANRGQKPHRSSEIGAREAERLLGISRSAVLRLAKIGQLPARIDEYGGRGGRRWTFKVADVTRLRDEGTALRRPPRPYRARVAWIRLFGPIPPGFTVICRDGDIGNTDAENLALAPLRTFLSTRRNGRRRRRPTRLMRWSREHRAILRRDYANRSTEDLAKELGCSILSVRCQARKMRLRKSLQFLVERARGARMLPIGTERLCIGEKTKGTIWVKVTDQGRQSEQWRPKHHVVWSKANGRPVPPGFRVIFKDGDKKNFDPANLQLTTRGEISARAFAQFLSYPPPLRDAIRLAKKLERAVAQARSGTVRRPRIRSLRRAGRKLMRWTPQMDAVLREKYPVTPAEALAAKMGVSFLSLKCRAARLALKRSPAAMVEAARERAAIEIAKATQSGAKANARHQ